ncbi:MAG: flagellar basal-body MS-ring/collar protein FliF [Vulcanimicrobiaceae bacterium]
MSSLLARWATWPLRSRIATIGACCVALALACASGLRGDSHVALYAAPLYAEQLAEVVERLAEWNVPFTTGADNVRVESRRRNDVLLKLSLAGIPHAHLASSTDVLAKAGPLTPQSVLDAQQRDGLAGDIASGLRGIAGIADARVIIAPAREGNFADGASRDATASVRLAVRGGTAPERDVLAGVRQYVAAAVPGLDASRVAILDDRGIALGDASMAGDEATAFRESLQSALDLALGAGVSIVRVRVSYDPRARSTRETLRKPLGSRPIATTSADERFKSSSKTYAKNSTATDRGSETRDERIETPGGRLERISVAVAVDQARRLDLRKIRSLATATIGLVASRGDTVSVEEVVFPHQPAGVASVLSPASVVGYVATLVPTVAAVAFGLIALRLGAAPAGRVCDALAQRLAVVRTTQAVAAFAPAHVRGALVGEPPHTAAAIISALPAATATAVLEMYPPEERAAIVRRMSRAAAPVVPDYETVLRRG